jgi:hypothetical protein
MPHFTNFIAIWQTYTDELISGYLQLLALQTAAERYYFGIRKSLVEFDEVMEVMLVVYSLYHGMGLP